MRLIQGESQYWAVGRNFVARVPSDRLGADGRPTPEVAASLEARDHTMAPASDVFGLTVLVTTKCNLACSYCFQNAELPKPGAGSPLRIPGSTVDDTKVADIMAFTRRRMAELDKTSVNLMLFGGEPTMYLDSCVKLLDGCRDIGLAGAAMISNGTLLTAPAAVALENAGLQWVQITLDGDKAEHDRSRITIGGRGTFEQILRNVEEASAKTALKWHLRVILNGDSIKGVDGLVGRLADRLEPDKFMMTFSLVYDVGLGYDKSMRHSADLGHRLAGLHRQAIDAGFTVGAPRVVDCQFCEEVGGTTGAVVNSDGSLYSCYHSAGQPGYDLGTVTAGYEPDKVASRWVNCGYETEGVDKAAARLQGDIVDAAILDHLYAKGQLGKVTSGQPAPAGH
ncbi:uncharacterized protein SAMN05421504_11321 [Amycolatopsis xylanica]|uniref:Radical SAM core domain-containing protein n=1 Tax=Amycolatopsis xylanica TaxID=589385 RepID=A0A1H3S8L2_9PSEU|nr:radical SAM protein [Amycolatopsis xylanica]SDZ34097.1 uncharacterized protein SAMN05421504_11321 [Amycolatopsis xylanica]